MDVEEGVDLLCEPGFGETDWCLCVVNPAKYSMREISLLRTLAGRSTSSLARSSMCRKKLPENLMKV
jgi:hypothetical protein